METVSEQLKHCFIISKSNKVPSFIISKSHSVQIGSGDIWTLWDSKMYISASVRMPRTVGISPGPNNSGHIILDLKKKMFCVTEL